MDTVKTDEPDAAPEQPGTESPTASDPNDPQPPAPPARFITRRRTALITATALAAAALTTVLTRAIDDGPHHAATSPAAPTTPVSYAVTGSGTAQITYTRNGTASTTLTAHLPWQHTTQLTPGQAPATLSIVLGQGGGHATCTLTLNGHPVQHATAYGTYGRATCTTHLTPPTP